MKFEKKVQKRSVYTLHAPCATVYDKHFQRFEGTASFGHSPGSHRDCQQDRAGQRKTVHDKPGRMEKDRIG